jgi:hypothetical protein
MLSTTISLPESSPIQSSLHVVRLPHRMHAISCLPALFNAAQWSKFGLEFCCLTFSSQYPADTFLTFLWHCGTKIKDRCGLYSRGPLEMGKQLLVLAVLVHGSGIYSLRHHQAQGIGFLGAVSFFFGVITVQAPLGNNGAFRDLRYEASLAPLLVPISFIRLVSPTQPCRSRSSVSHLPLNGEHLTHPICSYACTDVFSLLEPQLRLPELWCWPSINYRL